jgi:hypothetical protein
MIEVSMEGFSFLLIWQANNDIGTIKNHLLDEPKKQIEVSTKGVLIFSVIFLLTVALVTKYYQLP